MERNVLDELEEKINFAVAKIAELQRTNKLLKEEIKKLYTQIAEQENYIQSLKEGLPTRSESVEEQIRKYQETEAKVRKKISEMLAKLDSLQSM